MKNNNAFANLLRSIADVVEAGEVIGNLNVATAVSDAKPAIAAPETDMATPEAEVTLAAPEPAFEAPLTGKSDDALADEIYNLIEDGDYRFRKVSTLAEKTNTSQERVLAVARDNESLYVTVQRSTGDKLVRLS